MLSKNKILLVIFALTILVAGALGRGAVAQELVKDEGGGSTELHASNVKPVQLFDEGNYAMFIHWGIYSQLGNRFDGKTYYGIGEWMMHKNMATIPIARYKKLASTFHPKDFDAETIVLSLIHI